MLTHCSFLCTRIIMLKYYLALSFVFPLWDDTCSQKHTSRLSQYKLCIFLCMIKTTKGLITILFTCVNIYNFFTCFTFYFTTPLKFTLAPMCDAALVCIIASSTTHEIAPVHTLRVFLAIAPCGAMRPRDWV